MTRHGNPDGASRKGELLRVFRFLPSLAARDGSEQSHTPVAVLLGLLHLFPTLFSPYLFSVPPRPSFSLLSRR